MVGRVITGSAKVRGTSKVTTSGSTEGADGCCNTIVVAETLLSGFCTAAPEVCGLTVTAPGAGAASTPASMNAVATIPCIVIRW